MVGRILSPPPPPKEVTLALRGPAGPSPPYTHPGQGTTSLIMGGEGAKNRNQNQDRGNLNQPLLKNLFLLLPPLSREKGQKGNSNIAILEERITAFPVSWTLFGSRTESHLASSLSVPLDVCKNSKVGNFPYCPSLAL